jgi:hypothetical protein
MTTLYHAEIIVYPGEYFRMVYRLADDLTDSTAVFKYRVPGGPWIDYSETDPATFLIRLEDETNNLWSVVLSLPWEDFIADVEDKTSGSWVLELTDAEDIVSAVAQGFWKRGRDNDVQEV